MAIDRNRASLQTFHALQASDLAAAMNDAMKKVRVGPGDYSPELTAPDGPSTAGGVQAMQHLRLVARETGLPTLVVGHANHAAGTAELRTYEHIDGIHRQRFQRGLELDRQQYEDFLRFAKQLFDALHLQTSVVGPPADLAEAPVPVAKTGPLPPSSTTFTVIGIAVLLAVAMGVWSLVRAC